jgi:hypothetical protein
MVGPRKPPAPAKRTILPDPFPAVVVEKADREALCGGLISAGHPVEYARAQADGLPDTDGALQMLARHRIASASPVAAAMPDHAAERPSRAQLKARADKLLRRHGDGLPWERGRGRDTWAAAIRAIVEALSTTHAGAN